MTRAALRLPALLALATACSGGGAADSGLPPGPECGPQSRAVDFDSSWLPSAPGLDPEDGAVPFEVEGLDDGHGGVAYGVLLAGHYHIRIQRPADCLEDGQPCQPFGYQYDPVDDRWEDEESTARQLVATLAQVRQYDLLRRPELQVSARDALLLVEQRVLWSDEGARIESLGPTGLLALAAAEYQRVTGDERFDTLIDGLGATLLADVRSDGTYGGSSLQFAQGHSAFWRLYALTGEAAYLDALRQMAAYAEANTDTMTGEGDFFEFPYVYGLWAAEPLTELYRLDGDDWLADLVYRIGDDVMTRQYRGVAPGVITDECAWRGGWTPNSGVGAPNWNSTIKLEAMVDAWRMAALAGDADREAVYRAAAEQGAAWMLTNQYRLGDTDGFADPELPIGGFPLFVDDPDVRIDIPGHGSIALAKASAWLLEEETPGAFGTP